MLFLLFPKALFGKASIDSPNLDCFVPALDHNNNGKKKLPSKFFSAASLAKLLLDPKCDGGKKKKMQCFFAKFRAL